MVDDGRNGHSDTGRWHDIVAISASGEYIMGLRANGTVVSTAPKDNVNHWRDIVAISCGVGLKADGTVVTTNLNSDVNSWRDIGPYDRQKAQERQENWAKQDLCRYCGGQISGLFKKKCKICGRIK